MKKAHIQDYLCVQNYLQNTKPWKESNWKICLKDIAGLPTIAFFDCMIGRQARQENLFSARGRYFSPSSLLACINRPCISSPYEMVCFLNLARLTGRCAHGSWPARGGRSSAHTTYFPVWAAGSTEIKIGNEPI